MTPTRENPPGALKLRRITVEHREHPAGIDTPPRFGWIRPAGAIQTAWRVQVAEGGDVVWDSGMISGSESFDILYAGPPLRSLRRHVVRVSSWAAEAVAEGATTFVAGLPGDDELWASSSWIGGAGTQPAPLLHRKFELDGEPASAFLVVAAGGHARAELNGSPVDPLALSPGFTDYDVRVQYTVSDVTAQLRAGSNALGLELGRGFYGVRTPNEWDWHQASWNAEPCVRALLVWDDESGGRHVVGTDGGWRWIEGPTRSDDIFAGEEYDDRLAIAGWSEAGLDLSGWAPAVGVAGPRGRLEAQRQAPIAVAHEFEPMSTQRTDDGWLFAFERVISGWVSLELDGEMGEVVEVRLAERLGSDGLPDVSDPHDYYDGRFQTHRVTLAGRPLSWEPRFTYQGFQYVHVRGARRPRVRARLVHSAVERTGRFRSSVPILDELHELAVRTVLNNLHGYPTDTPSYEKNGWTGDGMLGAELMLHNLDAHPLLAKWAQDVADTARRTGVPSVIAPDGGWRIDWTPAPPWHAALVLVPWWLHLHRGDTRIVRDLWPAIERYLRIELARSPDGIASTTLGDWVTPETSPAGGNPPEDSRVPATAFLFAMLRAAASLATVVGDDPAPWVRRAAEVRSAFLATFLDQERAYVRGVGELEVRQSHQVLALAFGLVPASLESRVADVLAEDVRAREGHLNTGALGSKWLLPVLTRYGHAELALAVVTQRDFPGWAYWVDQGATTLWEHWHADSRSRNHYFLGTFDDWLFREVAGLRPTSAGWRTFEVSPRVTEFLSEAEAAVLTPVGEVAVHWRREGDDVALDVRVPAGARASVVLGESRVELLGGVHVVRLFSPVDDAA